MLDFEPGTIAMILLAYGVAAIVKGAIGIGTPFIVVPLLAPRLGLPESVAVLTFPLLSANIWQMWEYRAVARELRFLPAFLLGAAAGLGFGTYGLVTINPGPLMVFIGCLVMLYLGMNAILPNLRISAEAGRRIAPFAGIGSGVIQGLSGISAPISLTFLSALRLERPSFIFAASAAFLVFGMVQFVTLSVAGVMTPDIAVLSLIATVPTLVLMPLGTFLGRWLSAGAFRRLVLALLLLLALRMVYQGLSL